MDQISKACVSLKGISEKRNWELKMHATRVKLPLWSKLLIRSRFNPHRKTVPSRCLHISSKYLYRQLIMLASNLKMTIALGVCISKSLKTNMTQSEERAMQSWLLTTLFQTLIFSISCRSTEVALLIMTNFLAPLRKFLAKLKSLV